MAIRQYILRSSYILKESSNLHIYQDNSLG